MLQAQVFIEPASSAGPVRGLTQAKTLLGKGNSLKEGKGREGKGNRACNDRVYLTQSPAFATLRINAVFDAAKQAVSMVDATATFQYCSGPPGEGTTPLPACLNADSAQPIINLHPVAAAAAAIRILAQTRLMFLNKIRSPFTAGCSTVVADSL